jgi:hypothetical protein
MWIRSSHVSCCEMRRLQAGLIFMSPALLFCICEVPASDLRLNTGCIDGNRSWLFTVPQANSDIASQIRPRQHPSQARLEKFWIKIKFGGPTIPYFRSEKKIAVVCGEALQILQLCAPRLRRRLTKYTTSFCSHRNFLFRVQISL